MTERIQRKRTKGWRMPAGAIYCGRPSKWGNPYRVGKDGITTAAEAVAAYRAYASRTGLLREARRQLGGYGFLACFCPLDQPCHVDVLIEVLNGGTHEHHQG